MHCDCQCHWWFCSIWNITLFPPRASAESRERLTSILGSRVWNGWVNNLPPPAVKSWQREHQCGLKCRSNCTENSSLGFPTLLNIPLCYCNHKSSVQPALICSLQLPRDKKHWKMGKIWVLYDGAAVMTHQKCPVHIPGRTVWDSPSHNCTPVERAAQGEKLCRIMDDLHPSWGCFYRRLTSGCRFGAIFNSSEYKFNECQLLSPSRVI